MNSTSPWKDVTPWDNPINEQQDEQLYEIGCYSFGEPMGDEFQIRWEYIGYYYYFNYLWLDDVTLEACSDCAEYAELVEDITLEILNGSGAAGAAGDARDTFEELGYKDVSVGNTDEVEGNELYVDPDYEDQVAVLLEDVEDELEIEKITGELESEDYIARIVLGFIIAELAITSGIRLIVAH